MRPRSRTLRSVLQTRTSVSVGEQTFDEVGRLLPRVNLSRRPTERAHREVVAGRVETVADEQHVLERNAGEGGELVHPVRLVDPSACDVDAGRTARPHLEFGQPRLHRTAKRVLLLTARIPVL